MADFGAIFEAIGDFGLYQKIVLFALSFPNVFVIFLFSSVIFIDSDPVRHCNTDWILKADPNLTPEEQANLTLPRVNDGTFNRCEMFKPVDWDIDTIRENGLNEKTECLNGWVYDKSMFEATIVTDFDLVCDKANLVQIAQTVFMAGIVVGSLLFGPFAESFGRKRATQIPVLLMFLFIITTALCPYFYLYSLSQFMVGVGYGGFRVNCVVLATEWIGTTKRSLGVCVGQIMAAFGQLILVAILYFIRNWRLAQLVFAAPNLVVVIYIWFIPESARWLQGRGRTAEVKQLILRAAAVNKRTVPESLLEKIVEKRTVEKGGLQVIIKSPVLRKYFFTITFAWMVVNLTYYCLLFNIENLGMDILVMQLMFGLTELPVHLLCIWMLELLGRKISLISTILMGGLSCMIILVVPRSNGVAIGALAITGRFFMVWAGSICNIYVQELFPTSVRQTATGLGSVIMRSTGMLSPLLNMLAVFYWGIPTIVFSSLAILSGMLTFLLPETRGTELPESTDEAVDRGNGIIMCDNEKDHHTYINTSTKL